MPEAPMTASGALPTGTVTFLLTDIEGSSRLWQEHPDDMGAVIDRHDELLLSVVAANHGSFVKSRGEGDSSFSVFPRPTDAAAAAIAAQLALASERWPDGIEIRVRAALHSGEAELREGDYYGSAVNRCARLRSIAHGGQTICSQATAELVAESLPRGASLADLGPQHLRDLERPERVFQICHPDLPTDFPPLRSAQAMPNNLPSQLTTFIGREADAGTVRALLGSNRLVTLTGSGGCGKTRLGLHVAAELLDEYPDGVWWVDLGPLSDPDLVPLALGHAMGIREAAGEPFSATLERVLAVKHALVVLDNCEHLIEACAALSHALLRSCAHLVVLTTSREPLGVHGETTWRVPSLEVPRVDDLAPLSETESVRLFVDRAARARPSFELDDDSASAVAQICRRLDGIPLAIELAAARVRAMSPNQIAERLEDRFRLLGGGSRTAMPRQRTLEASVDWSFNLLSDEQRCLFRRLSVFAGTFSLEGAEAVCAGEGLDQYQVFDVLLQLVDRSLVQVEEDGRRYRLLETIRQYGRQKLADAGEGDTLRAAHLAYYAGLAERALPLIKLGGTVEWLGRLDDEIDNIRAAADWAVGSGYELDGLRLVTACTRYFLLRGHSREARSRIEYFLEAADPGPHLLARSLVGLMHISALQNDASARPHAERALALLEELDDPGLEAIVRVHAADLELWTGRGPVEAGELLRDAAAAAARAGQTYEAHLATVSYATTLLASGDVDGARSVAGEAAVDMRATGDVRNLSVALSLFGGCSVFDGLPVRAEAELGESLAISASIGDRYQAPVARALLAMAKVFAGDYAVARDLVETVLRDARDSGSLFFRVIGSAALTYLERALGNPEQTLAAAESCAPVLRMIGFKHLASTAFADAAWAASRLGDHERSEQLLEEAAADAGDVASPAAHLLCTKSALARERGDMRRAEDHARAAVALGPCTWATPAALEALAGVLVERGETNEAARLFGAGHADRARRSLARRASDEELYQADVAAVRNALGAEAFAKAWEEGAELSIDDAVAYATRGRGARQRPSSGWESLTPTELEVVKLVAEGLSNPQIAEKMFISRRTVTTHLTHIFAKLALSSRTELTAEAIRRGRPTASAHS